MKNWMKKHTLIFTLIISIFLLALSLVILTLLKQSVRFSEWYSTTIGRWYQTIIQILTKYIPFSLTEFFFLFLIITGIILLVISICMFVKKRVEKGFITFLHIPLIVLSVLNVYFISCEFNFNRKPLPFSLHTSTIYKDDFEEAVKYYYIDYLNCASFLEYKDMKNGKELVSPYSFKELNDIVINEYKSLCDEYTYFNKFTTKGKKMMTSFLFREFNITGVDFNMLGEANINILSTNAELPFVIAHEIAHSKGVMREDDAQMTALYICLNSDNYYLRYSGYLWSFGEFKRGFYGDYPLLSDEQIQTASNINSNIKYINQYWKDHDLLSKLSDWVNNLYIKSSSGSTSQGTGDYNDSTPTISPETKDITHPSRYQSMYYWLYERDIKNN